MCSLPGFIGPTADTLITWQVWELHGFPWFSIWFSVTTFFPRNPPCLDTHGMFLTTRCFCLRFFEIYNEIIFDLLNPVSDRSKLGGGLQIKEHPVMGIYVKDLTVPELSIGHLSFRYDDMIPWLDLHPLPWCQDVPSCAKCCGNHHPWP